MIYYLFCSLSLIYNLYFFVFHLGFWKKYHMGFDLRHSSDFTKKIFRILNFMIAFLLFSYSALCLILLYKAEVLFINMFVLVQMALFWFLRAILHAVFFDISKKENFGWFSIFILGAILPTGILLSKF